MFLEFRKKKFSFDKDLKNHCISTSNITILQTMKWMCLRIDKLLNIQDFSYEILKLEVL